MAVDGLLWFIAVTTALQGAVAVRLAFEADRWKRIGAGLFGLNAFATGTWSVEGSPFWEAVSLLVDGATAYLILALAFAVRPGRVRMGQFVTLSIAWIAVLYGLWAAGRLGDTWHRALFATLPLAIAYITFLLRVGIPFGRSPSSFDPLSAWLVGGMVVRMAEFPFRYLTWSSGEIVDQLFELSLVVLLGAVVTLAVVAASSLFTNGGYRRELVTVLGALLLGIFLGATDRAWIIGSGPEAEALRRFSLVVIRPLFFLVAAVGWVGAAGLVVPFAVGGFSVAISAPLFRNILPGERFLPEVLGASLGMVLFLVATATRLGRPLGVRLERGWGMAEEGGDPADPSPRWRQLLAALAEADPSRPEGRFSRLGLGATLGVDPRNVHRVVETANRVSEASFGSGCRAVVWVQARGRGGQTRYYYYLTPNGRRLLSSEAGSGSARAPGVKFDGYRE